MGVIVCRFGYEFIRGATDEELSALGLDVQLYRDAMYYFEYNNYHHDITWHQALGLAADAREIDEE